MGSAPGSINGRPASPEGFQFFVDTLKAAGISVEGITPVSDLGHDDLFVLLDRDRNQKLTQADFQHVNPGVFSDLRSVLGRYGFHLKDEMSAEPLVVTDPVPVASPPPATEPPAAKRSRAAPAAEAEKPKDVPELLAESKGWKPEEVEEKYRELTRRIEVAEHIKYEPKTPLGDFGDGFIRGDYCWHESWQAELGRFLGSIFNPFTNAVETGEAVGDANEERTARNILWAGWNVFGMLPAGGLGKVEVRGAGYAEEALEDAPKILKRLRGRGAEELIEAGAEIPRPQLKLWKAEEILLREGRVEIAGFRTPAKPRTISGPKGRLERSEALIQSSDLGTGTEVSDKAYYWIQDVWGVRRSDAGHVIGNQLGGKGGAYSNNLIPQSPNINRGKYQLWEGQVAKMVRKNGSAEVEITIHYQDEAATIPNGITYLVRSGGMTYVKWFGNNH